MRSTDDHMLADLRRQAEHMAGAAAPPTSDGEPVFDEPWQGRAMALAIETVAALGVSWDEFRDRLIAAISDDPHRSYYASWLVALDDLAASFDLLSDGDVDAHRLAGAGYRTTEDVEDDLDVFPLPADEASLRALLSMVLGEHWSSVRFGIRLGGASIEIGADGPPSITTSGAELVVDAGSARLRLEIGDDAPDRRRCAHAELQRQWIDGVPRRWMLRLYNGDGAQMLTVTLPDPWASDDGGRRSDPVWSRLELWDRLRERFLDLPVDPADRLDVERWT